MDNTSPARQHPARPNRPPFQFPLQMLFWTTFNVGLALAYLRSYGPAVLVRGTLVIAGAAVVGMAVGGWRRRTVDAVYWGLLAAACAFVCTVGIPPLDWVWPAVGAAAGAVVGALAGRRPLRTITAAAGAGLAVFAGYVLLFRPVLGVERTFDVVCSPIVGGLLGILVELISWLEKRGTLPRYVTASVLLCAVIAGDLLARRWVLAG